MISNRVVSLLKEVTGVDCWCATDDLFGEYYIIHTKNPETTWELSHYLLALHHQTWGDNSISSFDARHRCEVIVSDSGKTTLKIGTSKDDPRYKNAPDFSAVPTALIDGKFASANGDLPREALRINVVDKEMQFLLLLKKHKAEIRAILTGQALARERRNDGGITIDTADPSAAHRTDILAHGGDGSGRRL